MMEFVFLVIGIASIVALLLVVMVFILAMRPGSGF